MQPMRYVLLWMLGGSSMCLHVKGFIPFSIRIAAKFFDDIFYVQDPPNLIELATQRVW